MTDISPSYENLIDAETRDFIKRTEDWYPPETATFSIDRQRDIYNAMCAEFHQGLPAGVAVNDSVLLMSDRAIKIRQYSKDTHVSNSTAVVVYFHGGGFIVGGLESHDDVCGEICDRTGCKVVAVDYRLSPEHRHPAAFDDSMAVVAEFASRQELPLILCGDSAGGNLAAAVAHATRGKIHCIIGQVLIYPGLGGDIDSGSYVTHANAPLLTTDDVNFYSVCRTGGEITTRDPTIAPLHDSSFRDLPQRLFLAPNVIRCQMMACGIVVL